MAAAVVPVGVLTVPEMAGVAEGAGVTAGAGLGTWFLVATGVGLLVYAAYKCGRVIYRWSEYSRNACDVTSSFELLKRAANDEWHETVASITGLIQRLGGRHQREANRLRAHLEAANAQLRNARNEAEILRAQRELERNAQQAMTRQVTLLTAERDEARRENAGLRVRLDSVEQTNRDLREANRRQNDEIVDLRQENRRQGGEIRDLQANVNYIMSCMAKLPVQPQGN